MSSKKKNSHTLLLGEDTGLYEIFKIVFNSGEICFKEIKWEHKEVEN